MLTKLFAVFIRIYFLKTFRNIDLAFIVPGLLNEILRKSSIRSNYRRTVILHLLPHKCTKYYRNPLNKVHTLLFLSLRSVSDVLLL